MFLTLSFVADVAGLLGLSMQVVEKITKKYGQKEGEILGLLLALSEKSRAIKKVHAKYHSLYYGLMELNNYLKDPNNTARYKVLSNLNRDVLLEKIGESTLVDACFNLESHLKVEIRDLELANKINTEDKLKELREVDHKIAKYIEKIISNQIDVVTLHNNYLVVFSKLRDLIHKPELTETDAIIILGQRPFFSIHYNNIIYHTDEILMNYLDLYNQTLDYIKG